MDSIKKTHAILLNIYMILYFLAFIEILLYLLQKNMVYLYCEFIILLGLGISGYILKYDNQKKLKYLIHCSDAILEQKPIQIIDGEGDLSLLSHKLYLLHKRYYTFIDTMEKEQLKLKDYIEDISHQLKTPITSMRINEELLLETMENNQQKAKVQLIYQQTLKMNQLVNDLLTLALLDSNSIQFKFHPEKIIYLIEDVEENLAYLMGKQDVQFHLLCHDETLMCDHHWFVEALENILKNCIEKKSHNCIDILVEEYETIIHIIIQDHGEGFDEEEIEHLFERFYRGPKTSTTGVGIGLSLAKEIIEKHHGMIKAYNQDGAVFEISIPKLLAKKKI